MKNPGSTQNRSNRNPSSVNQEETPANSAKMNSVNSIDPKAMKKFFALLLAISMLFCSTVAFAAVPDTDNPQASNYFQSYGMTLSATGSGCLNLTFSCSAVGIADQLGVSYYWVQKKNSSGNWEDVTGFLSGSTKANTTSLSFAKTFHGVAGETYRVKCIFTCTKSGGTETKSYTSQKKTAY